MNTSKISFESVFPDEGNCLSLAFNVTAGTPSLAPGRYQIREWYGDPEACVDEYVLLEVFDPQNPTQSLAEITYSWRPDEQVVNETLLLEPAQFQDPTARALVEALIVHFRDHRDTPDLIQSHSRRYWNKQVSISRPPPPPSGMLSIPEVLRELETIPENSQYGPYALALASALEHRDAIVPELIASLERVMADPSLVQNRPGYSLHRFALYLLAALREPRAKETVLRFMTHPTGLSLNFRQADLVDDAARILASVFQSDPDPLTELALNRTVPPLVRGRAIRSLLVLYALEELTRENLLGTLRRILASITPPEDTLVAGDLLGAIVSLNLVELVPDVRVAFKQGQLEGAISYSLAEFEAKLGLNADLWASLFREWNTPIYAISECILWDCFQSPEDDDDEPWEEEAISTPYIAPAAVGRNDPCPCGSGKKYKKCCG
jgi:hypothetical protein